jgi:hypothetical protein
VASGGHWRPSVANLKAPTVKLLTFSFLCPVHAQHCRPCGSTPLSRLSLVAPRDQLSLPVLSSVESLLCSPVRSHLLMSAYSGLMLGPLSPPPLSPLLCLTAFPCFSNAWVHAPLLTHRAGISSCSRGRNQEQHSGAWSRGAGHQVLSGAPVALSWLLPAFRGPYVPDV